MERMDRPRTLRWELHADGVRMYHLENRLLEIVHQQDGGKRFLFEGHIHTLRTHGIWKSRTTIHCDGHEMLRTVHRGIFRQPRIVLKDGSAYTMAWKNGPLAAVVLRDAAGEPILSARLATEGGVHPEVLMAASMRLDERAALLLAFTYERFGDAIRSTVGGDDLLVIGA